MNGTENLTQNLTYETAIRAFKTKFRKEMLGESSFASHTSTPHVITSKSANDYPSWKGILLFVTFKEHLFGYSTSNDNTYIYMEGK